jgi:homoserine O-acetyltransferase
LQEEIARLVPRSSGLHLISSPFGHDGFLVEAEAVGAVFGRALQRPVPVPSPRRTASRCA